MLALVAEVEHLRQATSTRNLTPSYRLWDDAANAPDRLIGDGRVNRRGQTIPVERHQLWVSLGRCERSAVELRDSGAGHSAQWAEP